MKRLFSIALVALTFCAAASVHAQTWTVTALNAIGCNDGDTQFAVNFSGISVGNWWFDATVDAAGNRYTDEYFAGNHPDGATSWELYDLDDRGLQTANYPLPANTPITVTMTLRNAAERPVYRTVVTLSQCNGGVITSNVSTPLNTAATSVPTTGNAVLAALGLLLAGLGVAALRRRA